MASWFVFLVLSGAIVANQIRDGSRVEYLFLNAEGFPKTLDEMGKYM